MAYVYLPSITPTVVREARGAKLAALTDNGWIITLPPDNLPGFRYEWDGYTNSWIAIESPKPDPDYAAFYNAVKDSGLPALIKKRVVPELVLPETPTVLELRESILLLEMADRAIYAYHRFSSFLDRLILEGDNDVPWKVNRFQSMMWDLVEEVGLNNNQKNILQGFCDEHLASRGYTAEPQ
jgi:hypothetical protein